VPVWNRARSRVVRAEYITCPYLLLRYVSTFSRATTLTSHHPLPTVRAPCAAPHYTPAGNAGHCIAVIIYLLRRRGGRDSHVSTRRSTK